MKNSIKDIKKIKIQKDRLQSKSSNRDLIQLSEIIRGRMWLNEFAAKTRHWGDF